MTVQKNFVVKNGIEVNNNLIFADTNSNKVGIATTVVSYTLDVNGTIFSKDSIVTGFSTVNNLSIGGVVSLGNSSGSAGQYLVSTGTGVTWGAVPTVRSTDLQIAGVGATTFSTTYSVGLLDVYINGVKLSADEYTADDSATVVLDDACFGGETVEFISYSPFGIGVGGSSIQGITILDEGSPIGSALQVTSINFVGAAVTATGTGIGVTVYLSDYVSSSGIATVSSGLIGTPNIEVGIITATNVVIGGGTTQLIVEGDARVTGILTIGTSSITLDGSTNIINVGAGITIDGDAGSISASSIVVDGTTLTGAAVTFITAGSGISIDQNTGNVTITATGGGGGESYWEATDVGINTLSNVGIGTTNPTSALTVVGSGTSTSQLYVSGISTFVGIATAKSTLFANQLSVSGVVTASKLNISGDYIVLPKGTGKGIIFGEPPYDSPSQESIIFKSDSEGVEEELVINNLGNGVRIVADEIYLLTSSTKWSSISSETSYFGGYNNSSLVGIGSTQPKSKLDVSGNASVSGNLSVSGITTLAGITTVTGETLFTNQLNVSGVSTFAVLNNANNVIINPNSYDPGIYWSDSNGLYLGFTPSISVNTSTGDVSISGGAGNLQLFAPNNSNKDVIIKAGAFNPTAIHCRGNAEVELYYQGNQKFETLGTGVTVTGTTFTNDLSVSGIATVTGSARVGIDTSAGVILTSPNGTKYQLFVEDDGTLKTVAV